MISLQHPESLNLLQKYRQACSILKNTSRATRLAWYREALALDFQLHIIVDGTSVSSYFYDKIKNSWSAGIPIAEDIFLDLEKTIAVGKSLIEQVRNLNGRHIGVIVHVADEFATAELKPKFNNPGDLSSLRQTAYDTPGVILDDSSASVDQASWRVMPYPALGTPLIGTTITISRRLEPFVTALRELGNEDNFPIITHVLSAPMVAIMGLPAVIRPSTNKPFVAVLQYPWFTTMAFFNEHSDLRLIRSLQHRGQRCPSNFWSALATTNVSLEFIDPDIYILPLGQNVDTYISEVLINNFPNSIVETVNYPEVSPLPLWAAEPVLAISDTSLENTENQSHTFGTLRSERWFLQDFLTPSAHAQALFPSRNDIRLLRYFNIAKRVIFAAVILWVISMGLDIYSVISKPEWSFKESEATIIQQRTVRLDQEKKRIEHWNLLLEDRSKAWTSMEMMTRVFPEKSGIILKTFSLTVRPDSTPKQVKSGFIKEWKMLGLVRNESLSYLNGINSRDGISAQFANVHKITGDPTFDPTPTTRSLVVNLRTKENPSFRQRPIEEIQDSDLSTYAYTFELTIVQRFEANDALAIPREKAP